ESQNVTADKSITSDRGFRAGVVDCTSQITHRQEIDLADHDHGRHATAKDDGRLHCLTLTPGRTQNARSEVLSPSNATAPSSDRASNRGRRCTMSGAGAP